MQSDNILTNEQQWESLKSTFDKLLGEELQTLSISEYFSRVSEIYNFCFSKEEDQSLAPCSKQKLLYDKTKQYFVDYSKRIFAAISQQSGEKLLQQYTKYWLRYKFALKLMNRILSHLNNTYVKNNVREADSDCVEIYALGMIMWRDHLLDPLKSLITPAFKDAIRADRDGIESCTMKVKHAIESYTNLNRTERKNEYYKENFEKFFIEETQNYYSLHVTKFLEENSIAQYLGKAESWLSAEHNRLQAFLPTSTEGILFEKMHDVLVRQQMEKLCSTFLLLLESWRLSEIGALYRLTSLIPQDGLENLWPTYHSFIQKSLEEGIERITPPADEREPTELCGNYVEFISEIWHKHRDMIKECFRDDSSAVKSRDVAFKTVINDNAITKQKSGSQRSASLVAKHCDKLLRKTDVADEAQENRSFDEVMIIFRYLVDVDVFMMYYQKLFSTRLLENASASITLERGMISRLNIECGMDYTSKLTRMLQDYETSMNSYSEYKRGLTGETKELFSICNRILILGSAQWPLSNLDTEMNIPNICKSIMDQYTGYYNKVNQGKRLQWLYQQCVGELRTKFTAKPIDLTCSTTQISILMCFDQNTKLAFHKLKELTLLNDNILEANMKLLLRTRLISLEEEGEDEEAGAASGQASPAVASPAVGDKKDSKKRKRDKRQERKEKRKTRDEAEITTNTVFCLNLKFTNKKGKKLNINRNITYTEKKGPVKSSSEQEEITTQRKLATNAAMVRIMKMRGICSHTELLRETTTQMIGRFPQVPRMQKKSIEWLIQEKYIERAKDNDGTAVYKYLA